MSDGSQTRIYVYLPPHVSAEQEKCTFALMESLSNVGIDVRVLSKTRGMTPVLQRGHLVIRVSSLRSVAWIEQGIDWQHMRGTSAGTVVHMLSTLVNDPKRDSREVRPLSDKRKEVVLLTKGMTRRGREQLREMLPTYTHVGSLKEDGGRPTWIKNDRGDFTFVCLKVPVGHWDPRNLTIYHKGKEMVNSDYPPGTDPKVVYYDALAYSRGILKEKK